MKDGNGASKQDWTSLRDIVVKDIIRKVDGYEKMTGYWLGQHLMRAFVGLQSKARACILAHAEHIQAIKLEKEDSELLQQALRCPDARSRVSARLRIVQARLSAFRRRMGSA